MHRRGLSRVQSAIGNSYANAAPIVAETLHQRYVRAAVAGHNFGGDFIDQFGPELRFNPEDHLRFGQRIKPRARDRAAQHCPKPQFGLLMNGAQHCSRLRDFRRSCGRRS